MAKQFMCDICSKGPFNGDHGVTVHKQRMHKKGKTWSTAPKNKGKPKKGGKQAIEDILAENPAGLQVQDIHKALKKRGFKLNPNYISQAAATLPNVMRIERGVYRLKKMPSPKPTAATGTALVHEAQTEAKAKNLPPEALLLRIETLEAQNRALHDAHMSLLRGVTV